MRRRLVILALLCCFASVSLWAQRRSGGAFAVRGGFSRGFHGRAAGAPSAGFHGSFGRPGYAPAFHRGFHRPGFGYPHRGFNGYRRSYPYAYYGYPIVYYNYWPDLDFDYDYDDYYPPQYYQGAQYYPPAYSSVYEVPQPGNDPQQEEINELEQRVEQLQSSAESQQNAKPPQNNVQPGEPTELIFRDGHTEKVQNYGIVGNTLWIFTEQQAKKISLANLDIPATKAVNAEHGVSFAVPETNATR
jgi:hypothetical protein